MGNLESILEFVGLVIAIGTFIISAKMDRDATEEQTYRETLRATLQDFAELRRMHQAFPRNMEELAEGEKDAAIRKYLADLERFAVGCNMNAYDIRVVSRMSGGALINQYRKYFKPYIEKARRMQRPGGAVQSDALYSEVVQMMRKLFAIRGEKFYEIEKYPEDERILERFLSMSISSTDEVFAAFRTLENIVEDHQDGKRGYLYVPGARQDRCLLVAHADTYFDYEYQGVIYHNDVVLENGMYHGTSKDASIGADDRSGCALLWLLRNSGHSLLILDGEEHGQIGAHYLRESNPTLFQELNEHSFILQFDRRGNQDYKCYNIPVTQAFRYYIEKETGYISVEGTGRTDICALCSNICGVNLSVGYYNEHRHEEYISVAEWKHTLDIARTMLEKPLQQFKIKA